MIGDVIYFVEKTNGLYSLKSIKKDDSDLSAAKTINESEKEIIIVKTSSHLVYTISDTFFDQDGVIDAEFLDNADLEAYNGKYYAVKKDARFLVYNEKSELIKEITAKQTVTHLYLSDRNNLYYGITDDLTAFSGSDWFRSIGRYDIENDKTDRISIPFLSFAELVPVYD